MRKSGLTNNQEDIAKASIVIGDVEEEIEVCLSSDGTVIFSWNTPDIQELAMRLGTPQFDEPRWCG